MQLLQIIADVEHGLIASFEILRETFSNNPSQVQGKLRFDVGNLRWRVAQDRGNGGGGRVAAKRKVARRHLIEHDAEREDVGAAIELPSFVVAAVSQCDPGLKGDTASGSTKPATLETGAVVQVPLFIKEGENIRVDTRTGEYVERVA